MIQELTTVVLVGDVAEYSLKRGDVGAVVHCYPGGESFEVEFVTGEGNTAAGITLTTTEIRPMGEGEILHTRQFSAA